MHRRAPIPSPMQILEACQRMQAEWDDRERKKRRGELEKRPWEVPVIETSGLEPLLDLLEDANK